MSSNYFQVIFIFFPPSKSNFNSCWSRYCIAERHLILKSRTLERRPFLLESVVATLWACLGLYISPL